MSAKIKSTLRLAAVASFATFAALSVSNVAQAFGGPQMHGDSHACAQGGGMHGLSAPQFSQDPQKRTELLDARLNKLKAELKITAEQDKAWQDYAAKAKQLASALPSPATMSKPAAGAAPAPTSAPERLEQASAHLKQRLAYLEGMTGALKELYTALTPEQKVQADKHFQQMHQQRNKMSERHGMGSKRGMMQGGKPETSKPAQ